MSIETGQIRVRRKAQVCGVVQGVGFRPFVYRLAKEEELTGYIGNDTDGVTIEIEGTAGHVERFLHRLRDEMPLLARIDAIAVQEVAATGEQKEFHIIASEVHGRVSTGIPADAATCPDCLRELLDPKDRRYWYPFLNCTNCGPRYTITRRIPYDRPQTSMAEFVMCAACQAEYDDPANRRFHAQPNACWECGPRVWLSKADGAEIAVDDAVGTAIDLLMDGKILAVKGIGGFHLCVDATNEAAVMRLRERKHRYGKPLAVMVRDVEAARAVCSLNAEEEALLLTPARPIVLSSKQGESILADCVAPGIPWLGVFLPYAPLQHLLFADERVKALVMTSANLSEEPIAIANDEALVRLGEIADVFLMHDREILQRCDDSVTAIVDHAPQLIRRARGFVPLGVELPLDVPPMLAVGGHLKNVFALARGRHVYQSQHLGDLENLTGLNFFQESLDHLMRTFEIQPEAVVHDLHPGYLSTSWAKEWAVERGIELIAVQHHHAHVAGCMAEHGLMGSAIGIALDGTGYGSDRRIWGGEVLITDMQGCERFAHLEYIPLPGGDAAVREPWRVALSALRSAGLDVDGQWGFGVSSEEVRVITRMIERGLNSPLTSSCGRLFDAAAALILGRCKVDYEAQAAIELEGVAMGENDDLPAYAMEIQGGNWAERKPWVIRTASLWQQIFADLQAGIAQSIIAAKFHAGVVEGFVKAAIQVQRDTGIDQVVLSGGCMHNRRLSRLLRSKLEAAEFKVYMHRKVSPGDGGLSYGQIAVAAKKLKVTS